MRPHVIELASEGIEASLLRPQSRSSIARNPLFESAVHPLVDAVLLRTAWVDADRNDPQLDPPPRQLRQTTQGDAAAERRSAVGDHLSRQAMFTEDPLEGLPSRFHVRRAHRPGVEHVTAEGISHGQRIAERPIEQSKLTFEI